MFSGTALTHCAFFFFLSLISAHAQVYPSTSGGGQGRNIDDHLLIKYAEKNLYGESDEPIEGTPYLNPEFVPGDIYGQSGKYTGVALRYNIYKDYLEFKQQRNNTIYILDPNPQVVQKVKLQGITLIVEEFESKGKAKSGIYILLDSGKVTLLEKKSIQFKPSQEPKALETNPKPARYAKGPDDFYFKMGEGKLQKLESLKKLMALLPDHQDEVTQFAKENKISSNKAEELTRLIAYYNQLP